MNVGVDITIDRSVSSGTNLCPKNRVRFTLLPFPGRGRFGGRLLGQGEQDATGLGQ